MLMTAYLARMYGFPVLSKRASLEERARDGGREFLPLMTPVIILGGFIR